MKLEMLQKNGKFVFCSHPQPVLLPKAVPILMPNMHLTGGIASGLQRFLTPRRTYGRNRFSQHREKGVLFFYTYYLRFLSFSRHVGEGGAKRRMRVSGEVKFIFWYQKYVFGLSRIAS